MMTRTVAIALLALSAAMPSWAQTAASQSPDRAETATPVELDGQYRALREEAGYLAVRRNSTYDVFPHDWKPEDGRPQRDLVTAGA